jgi:DNA-binding GntR family transcriptional regulator
MQIYRHLRSQVMSGELAAGAKVPSARELAADYNVQANTAAKALKQLGAEGLTEVIAGKGTFVRSGGPERTAQDRLRSIRSSGRIYPDTEYARIVAAELVPAPDHIADALGLDHGVPVIRRLRVTISKDTESPVSVSTSWFDGQLSASCPALLEAERLPEGTPAYIERTTGRQITSGRDQSAADHADETDAELLGVTVGAPVKRGRNWLFDTAGDTVEYGESVAVEGRWSTYSYEIHTGTEG